MAKAKADTVMSEEISEDNKAEENFWDDIFCANDKKKLEKWPQKTITFS